MNATREAALKYVARGIRVMPVDAETKRPRTSHGCKDATREERIVTSWWELWPDAGLAVATGRRSGVVVIDVDPRHDGEAGIQSLTDKLGALPQCPMAVTPSGGWHYWLRAPQVEVPCSAGTLAPGVDVRGDGGYVVAPPTRSRVGAWEWTAKVPSLPEIPADWLKALTRPAERQAVPAEDWALALRVGASEGQRNAYLARVTGHLLSRDVDARVVLELAHAVNESRLKPPLARREVESVVNSIASREYGKRIGGRS